MMIANILATILVLAVLFTVRVLLVCSERMRVLGIVSRLAQEDISANQDWLHRYQYFDSIPFGRMVWQFWKPVKTFYKEMIK